MKKNVVPLPGVLSTVRSPPIRRASRRLITRPSPVPPYFRVVELSACVNDWKSLACCSGEMPMPVSAHADAQEHLVARRLFAGVSDGLGFDEHLALLRELERVADQVGQHLPEAQRVAPEAGRAPSGSAWVMSSTCFWITTERNVSVTSSSTSRRLKGAFSSSSLSASIFEKSRMSLRIPSRFLADEWATADELMRLGGKVGLQREAGHVENRVHRRADLVAHVRQEHGLGRGRLLGLGLGELQRVLLILALGDVADRHGDVHPFGPAAPAADSARSRSGTPSRPCEGREARDSDPISRATGERWKASPQRGMSRPHVGRNEHLHGLADELARA